MKNIERILIEQGYLKKKGFFARGARDDDVQSDPEKVWSKFAQENPIWAAAATNARDWYAKYPQVVDREIPDEDILALDAGCGYGRVAIPLLKTRGKLKIIGVDASTVMLKTFGDLAEKESLDALDQRLLLLHSLLSHLPFPDDTFDCIYSCAVLLHNPYPEVQKILNEFYRLLKQSGKLVLAGSFPNALNLEGLQNLLYSKWVVAPNSNGPVRAYTKGKVRSFFNDWKEIRILPSGVTIHPRQIANIPMPFGGYIKRVNRWVEQRNFSFIAQSSLFSKHFDVVAQK